MNVEAEREEVRQLRESVTILTAQCAQLDEANRAWQQYHQTQLDSFRNKLVDQLPIDENTSLDEIGQQIIDQMNKEREDSKERHQEIEKTNEILHSGTCVSMIVLLTYFIFSLESKNELESVRQFYINVVNELNQQLFDLKGAYEELDAEKQRLGDELEKQAGEVERDQAKQATGSNVEQEAEELQQLQESVTILTAQCAQLDEANRAWQQYHQTQLDSFRNKLVDQLTIDENTSLDEIGQQIIDQMNKERNDSSERYQALEKTNNDLQLGRCIQTIIYLHLSSFFLESSNNMESIRESLVNTINELNQELLVMKQAYDELDVENQRFSSELEKKPAQVDQQQVKQSVGMFSILLHNLRMLQFVF